MTTPLYEHTAWWLGDDVKWNMRFLHVVGRPISPREWEAAQHMRRATFSPREAAQQLNQKYNAYRSHAGTF